MSLRNKSRMEKKDKTERSLREQGELLPQETGIYLFKNSTGVILYIGKAKNLRSRVMQYINLQDGRKMVRALLHEASAIDFTITGSEKEALILEARQIKEHRPKFNVRLLDGGFFYHFEINRGHEWPMISLTRFPKRRKNTVFIGPFPNGAAARSTFEVINKYFPLRTCSDQELSRTKRPCLEYHMHRCLAPCAEKCSSEEYSDVLQAVFDFLQGKQDSLFEKVRARMMFLAAEQRYEEAAIQRDLMFNIQKTLDEQNSSKGTQIDQDIWGLFQIGNEGVFVILPFRKGVMRQAIKVPFSETLEESIAEVLSSLLNNWYQLDIPHEIILPYEPESVEVLQEVLQERSGRNVSLHIPKRGKKIELKELAYQNAKAHFEHRQTQKEQRRKLLVALQKKLGLKRVPLRIECFDNSHFQGSAPVSAMVVYQDGKPEKKLYRRFKIKEAAGNDDFAMMREVLTRRFKRGISEATEVDEAWNLPHLLIVDGGRGQLNIALEVLIELELDSVEVIGFSKPRTERKRGDELAVDKIVLPFEKEPIILESNDPMLLFLQQIRDETHDTVINYQRKVRDDQNFLSRLQDIPGVGAKTKKLLLENFGSVTGVSKASIQELQDIPGIGKKLAMDIWEYLNPSQS